MLRCRRFETITDKETTRYAIITFESQKREFQHIPPTDSLCPQGLRSPYGSAVVARPQRVLQQQPALEPTESPVSHLDTVSNTTNATAMCWSIEQSNGEFRTTMLSHALGAHFL